MYNSGVLYNTKTFAARGQHCSDVPYLGSENQSMKTVKPGCDSHIATVLLFDIVINT